MRSVTSALGVEKLIIEEVNWPINKQQYNIEDNIVSGRV